MKPDSGTFVIENALVLTMDPSLGDVEGDVVVRDGRIVSVGAPTAADGERIDGSSMIVMPGLVDTHRHTWQAALRFKSVGWTLLEYVQDLQQALAPRFTPDDVYAANLLGAVTALDAGITTLRDDSHVQNTPEHGDAAIQGLRDSGIRASFGHGWPSSAEYMTDSSLPHPADMERIRNEVLHDDEALVTMHAHLRGPSLSTFDAAVNELARARALGLRSSIHIGAEIFPGANAILEFAEGGLLGPDLTFVHCCTTTDDEMRAMAAAGCTASVTALIEGIMPGLGAPATTRLAAAGVTASFGVDVEVAASGDLFNVMRAALMADRLQPQGEGGPTPLTPRQILEYGTIGGAVACGLDDRTGSITPGKQADLILLRRDHLNLWSPRPDVNAVLAGTGPRDVDSVFVAGKAHKRHGELIGFDLDAIRDGATASLRRLEAAAGLAA